MTVELRLSQEKRISGHAYIFLRSSSTGPEKFHTGDVALRYPCNISDWFSLGFEYLRANNNQSEREHGRL